VLGGPHRQLHHQTAGQLSSPAASQQKQPQLQPGQGQQSRQPRLPQPAQHPMAAATPPPGALAPGRARPARPWNHALGGSLSAAAPLRTPRTQVPSCRRRRPSGAERCPGQQRRTSCRLWLQPLAAASCPLPLRRGQHAEHGHRLAASAQIAAWLCALHARRSGWGWSTLAPPLVPHEPAAKQVQFMRKHKKHAVHPILTHVQLTRV
jgi:hypothetical protein